MSCGQVAEHDTMIVSKDEEITRLKAQIRNMVELQSFRTKMLLSLQAWKSPTDRHVYR